MYSNNKIEEITIGNDRIHIWYKANAKKEILFSDLKGIYLVCNKLAQYYISFIVLISVCVAFLFFMQIQIELILFTSFSTLLAIILTMKSHKKYSMKIKLKDGTSIEKQVTIKAKNYTVDLINDVRKKIYADKIENDK